MCANFGDPTSRDSELTHKTHNKQKVLDGKLINSSITQKTT